ncbi:MAG: hypothetical protein V9E82_08905 [Candidatus Nanopelagicales bacterium]
MRWLTSLVTGALLVAGLGATGTAPAEAASSITLDKQAPASVLLGDPIPYKLVASNPAGNDPLYNVSFSDVLPAGFEYVPNSTTPAMAGNPQIDKTTGTLVWSNVTDLQPASTFTLAFQARPKPLSTILDPEDTNTAWVAGQQDERKIPKFTPNGVPIPATGLTSDDDATTTKRDPFVIEKEDDNSPEGELLRGVHKNRTVYKLTIRNNKVLQTRDISVVDYIPAGMEFLGCGTLDNSRPGYVEYTDAPRLGVPAIGPSNCDLPSTVETVEDPPGYPAGVYTKVTWNSVPDLDPDQDYVIRYVAGIPMSPNTMTWDGPGEPSPDSLQQGSNLDNNNGVPTTREGATEQSLVNFVEATGSFTEGTDPPRDVTRTVTSKHSVTIEDLRMRKTADTSTFEPGGIVNFTFQVETSEYVSASNVVITDTLPDGFCPLDQTRNFWPAAPGNACAPSAGPSTPYAGTAGWTGGDYTIPFDAVTVPNILSGTNQTTVTFPARMLPQYRASGLPTLAGDAFRNTANLVGTTTSIPQVAPTEQGSVTDVTDDSDERLATVLPTITKQMKPRPANPAVQGMDCAPGVGDPYADSAIFTDSQASFRNGDLLCFRLRVDFKDISTGSVLVTDFLPPETAYIPGSAVVTPGSTTSALLDEEPLKWQLGTEVTSINMPTKTIFVVAPGAFFEVRFAARVLRPATTQAPDLTGNLMKMRTVNTAGQAQSYRTQQDFTLLPPPNLSIAKGVRQTTAPAAGPLNPPQDGRIVQQGSVATFQIDVKNTERPDTPPANYSARGIEVWDVLPDGIGCAAIGNYQYISTSGGAPQALASYVVCQDPPVNGQNTKSYIKWTLPNPDLTNLFSVDPDKTLSLLYDMTIPNPVSVSTTFTNTAHVRSFTAFTDETGQTASYFPDKNIDVAIPTEDYNAPEMKDPSNVKTADATVSKTGSTQIDDADNNNNKASQATIGEEIYYRYSVTVPAKSTEYNGVLTDSLPTGIELVSVTNWGLAGTPDTQPVGFAIDNATGKLTFPTTYTNTTDQAQVFFVEVTAKVTKAASACAGETLTVPCVVDDTQAPGNNVAKTNTARFNSKKTLDGDPLPERTGTKTVRIMQPNPKITKSASPGTVTSSSEVITYTLTASNPTGRSPMYDVTIVDCVPDQVAVQNAGTGTLGSTAACSTTNKVSITWQVARLNPNTSTPLTYTATIKAGSAGNVQFRNTVAMTGSSMPGVVAGEREYATGANADVLITGGQVLKDVSPAVATIGQTVTSTIDVQIPDATYSNLTVLDTMPPYIAANADFTTVSVKCFTTDANYANPVACSTPDIGYTFLSPVPATPGATGQQVGWALNVLPNSDKHRVIRITYTSRVTDLAQNQAGVTRENTALARYGYTQQPTTVAEATQNPSTLIGSKSDSFSITEPSLSIVKKVNDLDEIFIAPGNTFTYTLKVTNASGANVSDANNITVTDDIPASIEVVGSPSDGGQVSGSTITWTISSLAPGADKTVSFVARLKPPADAVQTNTATIGEYYSLPSKQGRQYTGPSDTAKVNPVLPVLTISKDASAPLAYIDDPYTWTIAVSNASGVTAYGVDVQDSLPANWTYEPNSAEWVITGGTPAPLEPTGTAPNIAWNDIADLPTGKTLTITFQAVPGPDVVDDPGVGLGTEHENSARTSWTLGPAGQGWGTQMSQPDSAYTEIASADLALVKTHQTAYPDEWNVGPDEVVPGTEFEWVLQTTNNGPDPSFGPFTIVDTLPAGVEYRDSAPDSAWTCDAAGQTVTCTNPGPDKGLAKDGSLEDLVLTVAVEEGVTGDLLNTATVTGRTYDPDLTNNNAEDKVSARPLADVAIVKTRTQPYVVGGQVTYTLAVTNLGPSVSVKDITVVDTLPNGLSIASIDAGAWQCVPATGPTEKLTCVLSQDLAANQQAPLIKVTVDVEEAPGSAEAVNTATVTPTTEDYDLTNNTSSVKDPVVAEVKLGIAKKTTGANPVVAGEKTEFTITVTNQGPAKAKNVTVVDTLQAGLRATAASGTGWTCDVGGGSIVTCTRPNFAVKDSPSDIVISADVDKSIPGGTTLKNTATVTTTSPQPGGDPDPAVSTVDVIAKSDLAVVKTHEGGPWTIGQQGVWKLRVTNNGPSDNPGPITIVDTLPSGNTFVSGTGEGWACSASGQTVTCVLAAGLQVGQSAEVSLRVDVVQGAFPEVVNPAEVSSPVPDTNPDNNRTTDQVGVRRAEQTANKLPPKPTVLRARTTEQGQKIRTRVRCTPKKPSAAGEVNYCQVKRSRNGTIRIKVVGSKPVQVTIIQRARGNETYKPWKRVIRYKLRP